MNRKITWGLCREINLWTYWQGRGYVNETPEIDYLLVGQDWGNPDLEKNHDCMQRIRRINAGETDVRMTITFFLKNKMDLKS